MSSSISPISRRSLAAAARVLEPGGIFAFTVETHADDGVILRDTLRFAHGEAHVRAALERPGLRFCHCKTISTRTEKKIPVPGLLVDARGAAPSMSEALSRDLTSNRYADLLPRPFRAMVRQARLDAARASVGIAREGASRPLGAADRADRRRQDAGGFSADAHGIASARRARRRSSSRPARTSGARKACTHSTSRR